MKYDDEATAWLKKHEKELEGLEVPQQEQLLGDDFDKARAGVDLRAHQTADFVPSAAPSPPGPGRDLIFESTVITSADLSDKQFKIAMLRLDGMTQAEIAKKLRMTQQAVSKHLAIIETRLVETRKRLKSDTCL